MNNLNLFNIRTQVAIVTSGAIARCEYFTRYDAQMVANPELFKY